MRHSQARLFARFRCDDCAQSRLVALSCKQRAFCPRCVGRKMAGEGATKAIPFGAGDACPVAALSAWLDAAGIVEGPLFRSITHWGCVSLEGLTGRTVAQLVKDAAEAIGRDPSRVSGHSLRAGFVTHALESAVSPADVVRTTKHRGMGMIMVYDRRRDVWTGSGL